MSDTWVWTLANYINSAQTRCDSPCFRVDGQQVVVTAQKVPKEDDAVLWLYVCMPQFKSFPPMLSFRCVRSITVVNLTDAARSIVKPKNERIAQFHSHDSGSWGLEFPKVSTLEKEGFLAADGSLKVEVQFFPAMFVKWSVPDFSSLIDEQQSPQFITQGSPWQLVLNPKDSQCKPRKRGTHVSAHFRCLALDSDEWSGMKIHAHELNLACVDRHHNPCHPFTRADALFSRAANKWGTHQLVPLSCLRYKTDWLVENKLEVIGEIRLKSVVWSLENAYCVTKTRYEMRQSPVFTLGSTRWKAEAVIKPIRKESEKERVTSLTLAISFVNPTVRRDVAPISRNNFVVRPGFQVVLADSNGLVQTMEVDADNRFDDTGNGVAWGTQCLVPYLPHVATADPAPTLDIRMTLNSRPSSVSWAIPNFSSFESGWFPLALKSGKLVCDGYEVELHVYPHGNGEGRCSHVSVFLSRKFAQDSSGAVMRKQKLSGAVVFTVRRDARTKRSLAVDIPHDVIEGQPFGASKFLDIKEVTPFLDNDGTLRIDALWGTSLPAMSKPPLPACCEKFQTDGLGPTDMVYAEKKRRDVTLKRTRYSKNEQFTDFDKAAEMMTSWNELLSTWTVPTTLGRDIEKANEAWQALSRLQDHIRTRVSRGVEVDLDCSERNKARHVFCERISVVELNYKDNEKLDALAKQEIPLLPGIESKYPKAPRSDCGAIKSALADVRRWCVWKQDWQLRKECAAILTDDAAKLMRSSLSQLFNADNTAPPCDEETINTNYYDVLHRIRNEELVLAERGPYFPVEPVVDVYYAIKGKIMQAKVKTMELWQTRDKMVENVREVEKWLDGKPDTGLLVALKSNKRRNQLMASHCRLRAQRYDLLADMDHNESLQEAWNRILEVEMRGVELELNQIDESYREDFNRLWELKRNHFPELQLPPRINISEQDTIVARTESVPARTSPHRNRSGRIDSRAKQRNVTRLCSALTPLPKSLQLPEEEFQSIFSGRRFLDMYTSRKHLSKNERILHVTYEGAPCVLKKFLTNDDMLREAKIQHKLRHPSIVPIQAAFPDIDASYIQLPLYKADLLAWLTTKRITNPSTLKSMITNIIEATTHIHNNALVHGDLHARNFLVDDGDVAPRLVLCGFGKVTTVEDDPELNPDGLDPPRSLGEHGYVAPELIRYGSRPSKETDMYSVGCIILKDLLPRCTDFRGEFSCLGGLQAIRDAATSLCSREEDKRREALSVLNDLLALS